MIFFFNIKTMKLDQCLMYAIIVSILLVTIVMILCHSSQPQKSEEDYEMVMMTNAVSDDPMFHAPPVSMLQKRLCSFPDPDYGQYSYAGCRCSRVGTPMSNGTLKNDQLYQ